MVERVYLVDNGSLRPESTRLLRRLAAALTARSGHAVVAAPLLHADRVDPALLDGVPALTWEQQLRRDLAAGQRSFGLLPYFFGPTGAITTYVPERLALLRREGLACTLRIGPFIHTGAEDLADDLIAMLVDRVRACMAAAGLRQPPLVLVDHGSPLPQVTAVREAVAARLRLALGGEVGGITTASMERRPGEAYAFNEPLLANLLGRPGFAGGDVVVALLFLAPGRHAGTGGDIDRICAAAEVAYPGLRTHRTEPLGSHPRMPELLARRLRRLVEGD